MILVDCQLLAFAVCRKRQTDGSAHPRPKMQFFLSQLCFDLHRARGLVDSRSDKIDLALGNLTRVSKSSWLTSPL